MIGTDSPHESIGAGIRSGVAWKAASQIALQLSRMVVALLLARMLAPQDWGLAAMVLVFAGFVVVFTDSALGPALIQRRRLDEKDRSTVFWTCCVVGLVLMVSGIALSGPIAAFYDEPEVRPLFAVLSIGFLVSSLGTTQAALLAREMRFRVLELRQIAATTVGAVIAVGVAVAGYGPWAIVAQQVAEAVTSTALLWYLSAWRPSFSFSFASLRNIGGFAGNVFGENVLYQAGRNLGSILIGRVLGAAALGTYALASNVILVPFTRIAAPLQQVFFPAFSRMEGDRGRIADVWIRATRLVGLISIPALVGLAIVAPDFVEVVLGSRWREVTPVIQILAVVGIVQSLQTLAGEVLLALDRSGWLFRFTVFWFVATVTAFGLGLKWGVVGVAVASAVATVVVEPVRTYITCRALGIPPWRVAASLAGLAQASVIMAAVVLGGREALIGLGLPAGPRLAVVVLLGALVYGPAVLWRAPDLAADLKSIIRRFRQQARAAQPAPVRL